MQAYRPECQVNNHATRNFYHPKSMNIIQLHSFGKKDSILELLRRLITYNYNRSSPLSKNPAAGKKNIHNVK